MVKPNYEWKPRHAYLATLNKIVYLLIYTSKPKATTNRQKPNNYWTLHKASEDFDPRGFSTSDGANDDINHVGLQTKDPEGFQFVGMVKNPLAIQEFISKAKEALGEDYQRVQGATGMNRRAQTVPPGWRPNIATPYENTEFNLDSASMEHLRGGSSTFENPSYQLSDEDYARIINEGQSNESSSATG